MSRIRKLSMNGIRNFEDGENTPTIHFSRPLTLILGPNGTGKTTIIECLRFALSGEFPPNTNSGKSFIHDPMLKKFSSVVVRGNVKAEVVDCRGDRLTISRTLEGVLANASVKLKTLDSTMTRVDHKTGKKTSLSGTCAEVDMEMMSAMGISKAILNYVMLCHQEDSDWPFDTGKKLKDRFDEIFDTTRYNKAQDELRKLVKEKRIELKLVSSDEHHLKVLVTEVEAKERKLKDFEERRTEAGRKIEELKKKLEVLNTRLAEIRQIEMKYQKWQMDRETHKAVCKQARDQIESLKAGIIELYDGTTEGLIREIDSFESVLDKSNAKIEECVTDLRDITRKEEKLSEVVGEKTVSVGTLKHQINERKSKIVQRNNILKEMCSEWELDDDISDDLTEGEAAELIKRLEEKLHRFEQEIESNRLDQDREQEKIQQKVNFLRSEQSSIESQLTNTKRELLSTREEIRQNSALLKKSSELERRLNDIDGKCAEANGKVEELEKTSKIEDLKRRLEEATIEEEKDERRLNSMEDEIKFLRDQSMMQMQLESTRAKLMEKEKELGNLEEKYGETLKLLLGTKNFAKTSMSKAIDEVQTVLNERISKLKKEIEPVQYEVTALETSLKHKSVELSKRNEEIQEDKSKVSLDCGENANYNDVLLLHSKKLNELEENRAKYAYRQYSYTEYEEKLAQPKACCPLCDRGFPSPNEAKKLASRLKYDRESFADRLKICDKELALERKKHDALLQLQPIVEKIKNYEKIEKKTMTQEIERNSKSLFAAKQKSLSLQKSMIEPEKRLSMCKDMIGDMTLWDRCSADIAQLNTSIAELQSQLEDAGWRSNRTTEEAQSEQDQLQQSLKDTRREIKKLQSMLDSYNEELRRAKDVRTKYLEEQLRVHKGMQDVKQAKENLKTLRAKETTISENVDALKNRLVEIVDQCTRESNHLDRTKKSFREAQESDRKMIMERTKEYDKIISIHSEVNESLSRKIDAQLRTIEEELAKLEKSRDQLVKERSLKSEAISKLRHDLMRQDSRKRELTDNLTLRNKKKEVDELTAKIENLTEKLENANYEDIAKNRKTTIECRDSLDRQINFAHGKEEELDRNIADMRLELEKSTFKNARENYTQKCIQSVLLGHVIDDIRMYTTALDAALMAYHTERIENVNKCMKKLWNIIYKGTDTSSIRIAAETMTSSSEVKRQYNYKILQVKHGVEMDMRGRSSAGQKVLASIILRLALAETFCDKCGVLALDEPTTNLDEENSRSLAAALFEYVKCRAIFQKNFQLVIITHDDNFITKLGQLSNSNCFWQLFRYDSGMSGVKCVTFGDQVETLAQDEESSGNEADEPSAGPARKSSLAKKQRLHKPFE